MNSCKYNGISCLAFITVFFFLGVNTTMAIEKAKYTVLEKEDGFEIRQYDPQIVAETFVGGYLKEAGNVGFRRLYAYISGDNKKKQPVAMTAPVRQEAVSVKIAMTAPVGQEKKGEKWRITFLMPGTYTLKTLPEPNDPRVRLVQARGRLMAAVKYSGTWSEGGYRKNKTLLEGFIQRRGLTKVGVAIWARYDPPFMPWFLRRNEVLIPVEELPR
jgi:hypothetical protein